MAGATILNPIPDLTQTWQLMSRLKTIIGDIPYAPTNLMPILQNCGFAVDVIDVSSLSSIAVRLLGTGNNDDAGNADFYGWNEGGSGHHLQAMNYTFGNFTSAANTGFHASPQAHSTIRAEFLPGTAYRGVDTYSLNVGTDYSVARNLVTTAVQSQTNEEADFPSECQVNLPNGRYKYFGVLLAYGSSMTVGAIFKPLGFWKDGARRASRRK